MPEMTAMSVSSVININAMSTESTSLSADNSKTPITETIDKSYTSTNATNIIQEVSTLTTTTTIRFNTLQTHISSTETTPEMNFTTLSEDSFLNDTNYSTKLPQLFQNNLTQDSVPNVSTVPPQMSTTLKLTTVSQQSSATDNQKLSSGSLSSTLKPILSTMTSLSSNQTTQSLSTSVTKSSTEKNSLMSTISSEPNKITNNEKVSTGPITWSTFTKSTEKSTKLPLKPKTITTSKPLITSLSTKADLVTIGSTKQSSESSVTIRSSTLKNNSQTIPEMKVRTALSPQNEKSSLKISANKMTAIPNERHRMVSTTRQSLSSSSMNSTKYSLFAENTSITPMRRRRQFSTKNKSYRHFYCFG